MDEQKVIFSEILAAGKKFVEDTFELYKLKGLKSISEIGGLLVFYVIILIVLIPAFLLANFAVAFLIGEQLESLAKGFLIVAAAYFLIGILLFAFKNKLTKWFINLIIKSIFKT
ncbi:MULTISPECIES: hypothetical protein [Flavobacterium]|uniref:Competence protein n=1 Tax=Flavobacterium aurantiibacter TaxID=2023067 RepID=A0A255ZYT2_9FLAO|nr:hypothetical protein [Flavobacterium aurantiibacter]OYQ46044.1 hypothetical protein CHX27_05095 [Flavobacterium aurantiibacter]